MAKIKTLLRLNALIADRLDNRRADLYHRFRALGKDCEHYADNGGYGDGCFHPDNKAREPNMGQACCCAEECPIY